MIIRNTVYQRLNCTCQKSRRILINYPDPLCSMPRPPPSHQNCSYNSGSQRSLVPGVSCQTTVPLTSSECYTIGSTAEDEEYEEEEEQHINEDDPMAIAYV